MNTKRKMALLVVMCVALFAIPTVVYAAQSDSLAQQGRIWSMGVAPLTLVICLAVAASILAVALIIATVIARRNFRRICRNKLCNINPVCDADKPYDFGNIETPDEINATRQFQAVASACPVQSDMVKPATAKAPIIDPVDIMLQQVIARLEQEALREAQLEAQQDTFGGTVYLQLVPEMAHARKPQQKPPTARKAG
jgi:hypothetical protein